MYGFLNEAIARLDIINPFRGPVVFRRDPDSDKGEANTCGVYTNEFTGDIKCFQGKERILGLVMGLSKPGGERRCLDDKTYEGYYQGGILVARERFEKTNP